MEHDANAESRHLRAYAAAMDRIATDTSSAVRTLFRSDATFDRPQYAVRASGAEAIVLLHEEQAGIWPGRTRRLLASGDILVAESRLDGKADAWYAVRILEFAGDQVIHASEYLAEPYDPPEARMPWVQPLEEVT
jgi:hypothetical protein